MPRIDNIYYCKENCKVDLELYDINANRLFSSSNDTVNVVNKAYLVVNLDLSQNLASNSQISSASIHLRLSATTVGKSLKLFRNNVDSENLETVTYSQINAKIKPLIFEDINILPNATAENYYSLNLTAMVREGIKNKKPKISFIIYFDFFNLNEPIKMLNPKKVTQSQLILFTITDNEGVPSKCPKKTIKMSLVNTHINLTNGQFASVMNAFNYKINKANFILNYTIHSHNQTIRSNYDYTLQTHFDEEYPYIELRNNVMREIYNAVTLTELQSYDINETINKTYYLNYNDLSYISVNEEDYSLFNKKNKTYYIVFEMPIGGISTLKSVHDIDYSMNVDIKSENYINYLDNEGISKNIVKKTNEENTIKFELTEKELFFKATSDQTFQIYNKKNHIEELIEEIVIEKNGEKLEKITDTIRNESIEFEYLNNKVSKVILKQNNHFINEITFIYQENLTIIEDIYGKNTYTYNSLGQILTISTKEGKTSISNFQPIKYNTLKERNNTILHNTYTYLKNGSFENEKIDKTGFNVLKGDPNKIKLETPGIDGNKYLSIIGTNNDVEITQSTIYLKPLVKYNFEGYYRLKRITTSSQTPLKMVLYRHFTVDNTHHRIAQATFVFDEVSIFKKISCENIEFSSGEQNPYLEVYIFGKNDDVKLDLDHFSIFQVKKDIKTNYIFNGDFDFHVESKPEGFTYQNLTSEDKVKLYHENDIISSYGNNIFRFEGVVVNHVKSIIQTVKYTSKPSTFLTYTVYAKCFLRKLEYLELSVEYKKMVQL